VTAAAAETVTMISGFGKVMRSPTARLEYGPASIRRDHSRIVSRSRPGTITGRFIPIFIFVRVRGAGCGVRQKEEIRQTFRG
jgi:hypothetical protein